MTRRSRPPSKARFAAARDRVTRLVAEAKEREINAALGAAVRAGGMFIVGQACAVTDFEALKAHADALDAKVILFAHARKAPVRA